MNFIVPTNNIAIELAKAFALVAVVVIQANIPASPSNLIIAVYGLIAVPFALRHLAPLYQATNYPRHSATITLAIAWIIYRLHAAVAMFMGAAIVELAVWRGQYPFPDFVAVIMLMITALLCIFFVNQLSKGRRICRPSQKANSTQ